MKDNCIPFPSCGKVNSYRRLVKREFFSHTGIRLRITVGLISVFTNFIFTDLRSF